jgi:hypothetical protein
MTLGQKEHRPPGTVFLDPTSSTGTVLAVFPIPSHPFPPAPSFKLYPVVSPEERNPDGEACRPGSVARHSRPDVLEPATARPSCQINGLGCCLLQVRNATPLLADAEPEHDARFPLLATSGKTSQPHTSSFRVRCDFLWSQGPGGVDAPLDLIRASQAPLLAVSCGVMPPLPG